MKKIVLLGSNGFLGNELKELLKLQSENYTLLCHTRSQFPLDEINAFLSYLDLEQPDIIINCAAIIDFNPNTKLEHFFNINVLIPSLAASWCEKNNRYYIHISSTSVHGLKTECITALSEFLPDSNYGMSKYLAELNIRSTGARNSIIKFGGIWSEDGPNHLGINRAILEAKSGKRLTISGGGMRNYIHVKCAAKVIFYIMQQETQGIFLAASPNPISIEEMILLISKKFNLSDPEVKLSDQKRDQIIKPSEVLKDQILDFEQALREYA